MGARGIGWGGGHEAASDYILCVTCEILYLRECIFNAFEPSVARIKNELVSGRVLGTHFLIS